MSISAPFIARPIATSLLAVAILLSSALAYSFLPISSLPQVDFPVIQVTTQRPGANADTMARLVTAPLERQLGQIASLTSRPRRVKRSRPPACSSSPSRRKCGKTWPTKASTAWADEACPPYTLLETAWGRINSRVHVTTSGTPGSSSAGTCQSSGRAGFMDWFNW